MEISDLNKSLCEELFGGELYVTEKAPDFLQGENSQVKQYREWLYGRNRKELKSLRKVEVVLEIASPGPRRICTSLSGKAFKRRSRS